MHLVLKYFISLLGVIHIIGDSNAPYCFTNQCDLHPSSNIPLPDTPEWLTYEEYSLDQALTDGLDVRCAIHWIQGRTMHRIGRDGIEGFDLKTFNVNEGDIVVFHFGAIDQGGHIYKQVILGREIEEIIETLVSKYLKTIRENQKLYNHLSVVVQAILPPQLHPDPIFVDDFQMSFPYVDFLGFQTNITQRLNERLEAGCKEHGFLFFSVNDLFETEAGGLRIDLSDGRHHVNPKYNFMIKERLIQRLKMKQMLS